MTDPSRLPQLVLLDRLVGALKTMPRVRAAFLRGSFHSGQPDQYSDLDLFVVANADSERLLELGRAALAAAGELQWVSVLNPFPPRLRALVAGPTQLELTVVTPATLPAYEGWRVLFDHDQLLSRRGRTGPLNDGLQPEHVAVICDEFWWQVFGSIAQLKRGQLWQALHLLDECRDKLAQIMRWRRDPARPFEHYANLERHLTPEDQQALAQTLASYDLRSIAAALLCAADAFDPAAREVAAHAGGQYPATLAHLTKEHFIREFWALLAPGPAISA